MFQYIKIESKRNRYFCLEQNIVALAWLLFVGKDLLRPIIRGESKKLSFWLMRDWFLKNLRVLRKNFFLLIVFARFKYHMKRNGTVLRFKFFGQICVPVHKGYKIFDFRRGVVVKVFDPEVHPLSISHEIKQLKNVSQIDFVPTLKRWNIEEGWYEEEYVSGSLDSSFKPMDSQELLKKFCQELVPYINRLVLFHQPKIKNSVEYADEMIQAIGTSRLSKQERTAEDFNKIKNFLDSTRNDLQEVGDSPIFLVFAHGDFCPANMLNTKNGIKIIDWESAGRWSALFDFYSYYFYRPVNRNVSVSTLVSEIHDGMPFFITSLKRRAPEISDSLLKFEKIYRWVYYIEEVYKGVEREVTDKNLNILEDILGYIEAFYHYEEILACEQSELERVELM